LKNNDASIAESLGPHSCIHGLAFLHISRRLTAKKCKKLGKNIVKWMEIIFRIFRSINFRIFLSIDSQFIHVVP
jgi:hypothetical protein